MKLIFQYCIIQYVDFGLINILSLEFLFGDHNAKKNFYNKILRTTVLGY